MDRYIKAVIEEYLARSRQVFEEMRNRGIFTQADVENELDSIHHKTEKDLNFNNAYAMLIMKLDVHKHNINDSNIYVYLTEIAKAKNSENPSYVI